MEQHNVINKYYLYFLLLCFILTFTPSLDGAESSSLIKIEPLHVDLGKIETDVTIKTLIQIENLTSEEVTFAPVRKSCGCTSAELSSQSLIPFATGTLTILFDSTFKSGKQKNSIVVSTLKPSISSATITLDADVRGEILFTPNVLNFGDLRVRENGQQEITITWSKDYPVIIHSATSSIQGVTTKIHNQKNNSLVLSCEYTPTDSGSHVGYLSINYQRESDPSKTLRHAKIPVTVHVRGRIQVHPSRIFLGTIQKPTFDIKKNISITLFSDQEKFQITNVSAEKAEIECSILPVKGENSVVIKLDKYTPKSNYIGFLNDTISITTSDRESSVIKIPYSLIIKSSHSIQN